MDYVSASAARSPQMFCGPGEGEEGYRKQQQWHHKLENYEFIDGAREKQRKISKMKNLAHKISAIKFFLHSKSCSTRLYKLLHVF